MNIEMRIDAQNNERHSIRFFFFCVRECMSVCVFVSE